MLRNKEGVFKMSLTTFCCEQCNNIDIDTTGANVTICTKCVTGQWHGLFEEVKYDPSKHTVNNRSNSDDPYEDQGPSFG